jgi:hypothetical protein
MRALDRRPRLFISSRLCVPANARAWCFLSPWAPPFALPSYLPGLNSSQTLECSFTLAPHFLALKAGMWHLAQAQSPCLSPGGADGFVGLSYSWGYLEVGFEAWHSAAGKEDRVNRSAWRLPTIRVHREWGPWEPARPLYLLPAFYFAVSTGNWLHYSVRGGLDYSLERQTREKSVSDWIPLWALCIH